MNTEETNKLIAEFLQPTTKHDNFYFPQFKEPYIFQGKLEGYSEVFRVEDLKFHNSWDWLMEVVEKIENLTNEDNFILYDFTIFSDAVLIADQQGNEVILINKSDNGEFTTKIEATYLACVRFIEWCNKIAA